MIPVVSKVRFCFCCCSVGTIFLKTAKKHLFKLYCLIVFCQCFCVLSVFSVFFPSTSTFPRFHVVEGRKEVSAKVSFPALCFGFPAFPQGGSRSTMQICVFESLCVSTKTFEGNTNTGNCRSVFFFFSTSFLPLRGNVETWKRGSGKKEKHWEPWKCKK